MGNCQAVDAAALVIQYPNGRIERFYGPIPVSEVMETNPGHYVSLIIPLPGSGEENQEQRAVQFTRVKLLRPNDTLALGHAYRLVTTQEVMKVLRAKKYAKMKRQESDEKSETAPERQSSDCAAGNMSDTKKERQAVKPERQRSRASSTNTAAMKSWRPSLQSISEAAS